MLYFVLTSRASVFALQKFTLFNTIAYQAFCEQFGENAFEVMLEILADPSQVRPNWASRFMATVRALGYNFSKDNTAYAYITNHKMWAESRKERRRFRKRVNELKYREEIKKNGSLLLKKQKCIEIRGKIPEIRIKFNNRPDLPTEGKKALLKIRSENNIFILLINSLETQPAYCLAFVYSLVKRESPLLFNSFPLNQRLLLYH